MKTRRDYHKQTQRKNHSIPVRIEQVVARELERHTDHTRQGIRYSATCSACQVQQLGMYAVERYYGNRNFYLGGMRQPHHRGCE